MMVLEVQTEADIRASCGQPSTIFVHFLIFSFLLLFLLCSMVHHSLSQCFFFHFSPSCTKRWDHKSVEHSMHIHKRCKLLIFFTSFVYFYHPSKIFMYFFFILFKKHYLYDYCFFFLVLFFNFYVSACLEQMRNCRVVWEQASQRRRDDVDNDDDDDDNGEAELYETGKKKWNMMMVWILMFVIDKLKMILLGGGGGSGGADRSLKQWLTKSWNKHIFHYLRKDRTAASSWNNNNLHCIIYHYVLGV